MTTPEQRTLAVLQTREFLASLAERLNQSPETQSGLHEQAATLLQHYPDLTHMKSANLNCPSLFGKPPRKTEDAAKPKTLSGWISWVLLEDSERAQTVIAGVGLVCCIIVLSFLLVYYFAH